MILSFRSGKGSLGSSSLILLSTRSTSAVEKTQAWGEYEVVIPRRNLISLLRGISTKRRV